MALLLLFVVPLGTSEGEETDKHDATLSIHTQSGEGGRTTAVRKVAVYG